MDLMIAFGEVVVGLAILVLSADKFVVGAAGVAKALGISPFIIGMIVIGFGTSAPEMLVSAISSVQGKPGIALGNAYGSNIANIGLILGITALLAPVVVRKSIVLRELPLLLAVTVMSALLMLDGDVSRYEAICMLVVFIMIMILSVKKGKHCDNQEEIDSNNSLIKSIIFLILGLLFMIVSSKLLVDGAVDIAKFFGVSDVIIGLTVVAVGTSLPELASSIVAVRKGQHDMAMGNIVGSNMFNTLIVVGIAGCISDIPVSHDIILRDVLIMIILTTVLIPMGWRWNKSLPSGSIGRISGALLLSVYVAYTTYLVLMTLGVIH